jgi:uncharacterized protein DUF4058
MDPYLEDPGLWPDVHHEFISTSRALLNPQLGPRYVVRIEERVYVAEDDANFLFRIPDLRVAEKPSRPNQRETPAEVPAATLPLTMTTLFEEEVRESRLEIVDREGREVVTVIEFLSPANKVSSSAGRASFMKKRNEVMHSNSHWVEIDLLRQGQSSFPIHKNECYYRAHASRVEMRPRGYVWPIHLHDRLPIIQIPLRTADADVALDLQTVCEVSYDRAAYDRTLDYQRESNPPLSTADSAWADALLRQKGLRK